MTLATEKNIEKANEMENEMKQTVKEKYLDKFEAILRGNEDSGRLVGKSLTWADIYLAHVLDNVEIVNNIKLLTDDFPCLKKLKETVFTVPAIKAWVKQRPKTRY
jgi:glutathione S-transferase